MKIGPPLHLLFRNICNCVILTLFKILFKITSKLLFPIKKWFVKITASSQSKKSAFYFFEFLVFYSCIWEIFTLFMKGFGFELLNSQFEAQDMQIVIQRAQILVNKLFSKIKHFLRNCKFCQNQTCPWCRETWCKR